jgi:RNA polymerase sigma-70 factor (ECF subfamily)
MDVESAPSGAPSGGVMRVLACHSRGAARRVMGSTQPKRRRKVQDVVVDLCEENPESKNLSHGSTDAKLTAAQTSRSVGSDDELVKLLQSGSSSAFEKLHRLYSRRLFNQIVAVTRNVDDAEDALQDTFFQAFRAVRSFEGRSHIATWLTRIAINAALMKVRKRRTRSEVSFEWPSALEEDASTFDLLDPSPNPEQIYEEQQRRDLLAHAIERLDPTLRSTVTLWVSRGGSMAETASVMNASLCTVKARIYRARKKLQRPRLRER